MIGENVAFEKWKSRLFIFFMGPYYPALIALFTFIGHVSACEFYFNILILVSLAIALVFMDSVRPFIIVLCSYIYQISLTNSPAHPTFSDYYFTGIRLAVIVLLFVIVFAALIFSFIKNKFITVKSLKSLPLLVASLPLALAFVLNGAFSGVWSGSALVYGLMQIIAYFAVFYIFYLGFKNEESEGLISYFVYVTALIALVLIAETVYIYLSNDNLIRDGSVIKDEILYGWGIWNTAGQSMTITIPVLFYGVMRNKYPWFYFTVATLTLVAVAMTLSRSSLIFALLGYAVSAVLCCFFGRQKKVFRIIVPVAVLIIILAAIILREKIFTLLSDYIDRGFSDNGRYELWKYGMDSFIESPIFGKGFFGLSTETFVTAEFLPQMMHNTPVQLLASMGIFGLLAYLFYRVMTVSIFVRRPSLAKSMIGIALLTLLGQSMLDNFIFYVQPMFYYSIALAIICRADTNALEQ